MTDRILTVSEAADRLGVAPARVRALQASGALQPVPGHASSVAAEDVDGLVRRGVVRALDVAAVEGALDRALRRRLPDLLAERLAPLQGEVATALADVELTTARAYEAEARARAADEQLAAARARIEELEHRVVALQVQPTGLFRRRRPAVAPA